MSSKRKDIHAVRTMFYPGVTEQFLEAVLNISEKVRGLARKRSATSTRDAATVVGHQRNRPAGLHAAKF
jgi:hypothetical protein